MASPASREESVRTWFSRISSFVIEYRKNQLKKVVGIHLGRDLSRHRKKIGIHAGLWPPARTIRLVLVQGNVFRNRVRAENNVLATAGYFHELLLVREL